MVRVDALIGTSGDGDWSSQPERQPLLQPSLRPSLTSLAWIFLKIGSTAFGGLGATLALLERELVRSRTHPIIIIVAGAVIGALTAG